MKIVFVSNENGNKNNRKHAANRIIKNLTDVLRFKIITIHIGLGKGTAFFRIYFASILNKLINK